MPFFIITNYARATITETWRVDAPSEEHARVAFEEYGPGGTVEDSSAMFVFCGDCVTGDEEDREIVEIVADDGELANSNASRMRVTDNSSAVLDLLKAAEAFITGFEGDDAQTGVDGPDGLLARMRKMICAVEEG